MKKVFSSNSETCHVFAQQSQQSGQTSNGNIFFEGKKIYSYGYHYLLAEFLTKNVIMINDEGYSVSTGKHISLISSATNHYKQFYYTRSDINYVSNHIERYLLPKLAVARKPELYLNEINSLWSSVNYFIEFMEIKGIKNKSLYKGLKKLIESINNDLSTLSDQIKERNKKELKAKKARIERERKKALIKFNEDLIKFNNYELHRVYTNPVDEDFLRISRDFKNVETTRGAKVTVKEAQTLYKMIVSGKDIKGFKIGYYTVISINGTLKIGCHNINIESMHKVGNELLKLN